MELLGADGEILTREWFLPTEDKGEVIPFIEVLSHWVQLEGDMHYYFGADLEDPAVKARPWRWFAVRVDWLMSRDSTLRRAVRPPKEPEQNSAHGDA